MRVYGVINSSSGQSDHDGDFEDQLRDQLAQAGVEGDLHFGQGDDLPRAMKGASDSDAEVLLIGGGDGTVRHGARTAMETGKTLAVLPLGTLNLFARSLGMPLRPAEAVEALAAARPMVVDTATVNGELFLCQSALGLIPRLAERREQMRSQGWIGGILAAPRHLLQLLRVIPRRRMHISIEGEEHDLRTWFALVTNNRPDENLTLMPQHSRMDGGRLGVHWSQTSSRLGLLVLIASYAFNFMRLNPQVTMREAPEVVIHTRNRTCDADLDGEVICLESPLTYRIRPQSLRVLAPPKRPNGEGPGR